MNKKQADYVASLFGEDIDLGNVEQIDVRELGCNKVALNLLDKDGGFLDYFVINQDAVPLR